MVPAQESEDNLGKSVLSFHHEVSGNQTPGIRFGSRCHHLLSRLTGPDTVLEALKVSFLCL